MYSRHQLKVFGYSALVTDIAIQKKYWILDIGFLKDIVKIVESLEEFGLLIKGVSDTIENKAN